MGSHLWQPLWKQPELLAEQLEARAVHQLQSLAYQLMVCEDTRRCRDECLQRLLFRDCVSNRHHAEASRGNAAAELAGRTPIVEATCHGAPLERRPVLCDEGARTVDGFLPIENDHGVALHAQLFVPWAADLGARICAL